MSGKEVRDVLPSFLSVFISILNHSFSALCISHSPPDSLNMESVFVI